MCATASPRDSDRVLLLHGHYKFFRRRSAVRKVWCTVCKEPRLAIGFRSLVVIHLFYIPVPPIARVTDWTCASCGNDPRAHVTHRPGGMRWALVVAGLLIVAGLWVLGMALLSGRDPLGGEGGRMSDGIASAITLCVMGGIFGWVAWRQHRRTVQLGFDDGKTPVVPLSGDTCPLCGTLMLTLDNPRCERCQVEIVTG